MCKKFHRFLFFYPLKPDLEKWGNFVFICIAVTLQHDPLCRSQWAVTLYYPVASIACWRGQRSTFPPWPVVENMGTEQWWLHLYSWRSPVHWSALCSVLSLTSWPDRAASTPLTPWIINAIQHVPPTVVGRLCCSKLSLFIQSCSAIFQLKMWQEWGYNDAKLSWSVFYCTPWCDFTQIRFSPDSWPEKQTTQSQRSLFNPVLLFISNFVETWCCCTFA